MVVEEQGSLTFIIIKALLSSLPLSFFFLKVMTRKCGFGRERSVGEEEKKAISPPLVSSCK